MPHSHKPSAEERKYMHMSSVRMLNRDIEDLLSRAGIKPLVGPDTFIGTGARPPCNSKRSYILAEFYRCGNKLTAIPQRLYRARLVFQKGNRVPQIVREEILCLSDYQIGMLLGNNDAACYDVVKLAKRIKIALKRFERTAILSVAACRIANLCDGHGFPMDSRTWHLVRAVHSVPGLAAIRIASLYRIADKHSESAIAVIKSASLYRVADNMKQDQPKEEQQCP